MAPPRVADEARREEFRAWWAIVWPTWASGACSILMGCTDLAFLGHYDGGRYLPPASTASVVMSFTSCIMARGPGATASTMSANAYGAGQSELGGRRLQVALAFATLFSLLVAPSWAYAGECAALLERSSLSVVEIDTFGLWRLVGILPSAWYRVLQAWLSGRAQTRPALYTSAMAVLSNFVLNYVLIYGAFGSGGLGYIGSPLATSLSQWIMLAGLVCWSRREIARCWPAAALPSFEWTRCRDFLKLCLPLTISGLLEEFNMQLSSMFALAFGPSQLATHNCMLMSFLFLSMAMNGFASGTSARVSHQLVKGDLAGIGRVVRIAGSAMFCWSFVVMVAYIVLQDRIGQLFSDDPEVWSLSGQLSLLTGPLYFLISTFYLSIGVLEGIAKPSIILVSFLLGCYVLGLPCSYLAGFVMSPERIAWWPYFDPKTASGEQPRGCGLLGVWMGLSVGYFSTSLVSVSRLLCLRDWEGLVRRAQRLAELDQHQEALVESSCVEATYPAESFRRAPSSIECGA